MLPKLIPLVAVLAALAACAPVPQTPQLGPDGQPLPRLYRIGPGDESRIRFEMLDSVNALREASGAGRVRLDERLTAAAATHSRDMSVQNRPWHFGSDGSSPLDRVRRVGYEGQFLGETISETYETEVQTLAAWMEEEATRAIILDRRARDMGFAWYQEPNGKIWWTLVMGAGTGGEPTS
ncbi:CAP domain-containing protein [Rhodosalinus halophilus]|uniref:CAP domain-containing protein n=1 Tax=Rhodosalinus halophilus TaxID=2259333 RepID=A0A365U9N3_9RHOB|nr:CAP domain-containing protein [Rhodosalinus halophilus]RBI84690.1 CAP domain-containing protein [Rhodosalinus halophilus]